MLGSPSKEKKMAISYYFASLNKKGSELGRSESSVDFFNNGKTLTTYKPLGILGDGRSCIARIFTPSNPKARPFVVLSATKEPFMQRVETCYLNFFKRHPERPLLPDRGATTEHERTAMELEEIRATYLIAAESINEQLDELRKSYLFSTRLYEARMLPHTFQPVLLMSSKKNYIVRLLVPYAGATFSMCRVDLSASPILPFVHEKIFATYLSAVELKKLIDRTGYIHGDVKGSNLLVYTKCGSQKIRVHLVDGGNSVKLGSPIKRYPKTIYTGVIYHAPETVLSEREEDKPVLATAAQDIYSWGNLLLRMELQPLFSPEVQEMITRTQETDPKSRPAWSDLIGALHRNLLIVEKHLGAEEKEHWDHMITDSKKTLQSTEEGASLLTALQHEVSTSCTPK